MKFKKSCIFIFAVLLMLAACSESKKEENQNTDSDTAGDSDVEQPDNGEQPDNDEQPSDETAKSPDFDDLLPCGTNFGDYACDFTLPLDSGDWNFAENYSKDEI